MAGCRTISGRRGAMVWGLICVLVVLAACDRTESSSGAKRAPTNGGREASEPAGDEAADGEAGGREEYGTAATDSDTEPPSVEEQIRRALASNDESEREGDEPSCRFFPDDCPAGEACFPTGSGERRCAPFDRGKAPGDPCRSANDCNRGQVCVGGDPGVCRVLCQPGDGTLVDCGAGASCTTMVGGSGEAFDWGVCRSERDTCTMWPDDDCGFGQNCTTTDVGRRCIEYDASARAGDPCEERRDCAHGQTCVPAREDEAYCRNNCDENHPCEEGRCQPLEQRDYGVCIPEFVR